MDNTHVAVASRIREAQTPAEELRQILTRLEGYVPQVGQGNRAQAVEILELLDRAHALIDKISQHGADLGPERSRFQTVVQQLDRKLAPFMKQLGGAQVMAQMRDEHNPPESHSWWFTDRRLEKRRRDQRQKTLIRIGLTIGVLAILGVLYSLFLAPDEAVRERFRYEQNAQQALTQGNLPEALAQTERALSYAPGDPDLLVLKGVVLELLAAETDAQDTFDEARTIYGDLETFYTSRAQTYMIANRPDLAVVDADRIIAGNPDSAIAYFQRGNANATLGNISQAITDMEKASELAEAAGQTELQGMARVQLGNLMMLMSAPQIEEPTPEP